MLKSTLFIRIIHAYKSPPQFVENPLVFIGKCRGLSASVSCKTKCLARSKTLKKLLTTAYFSIDSKGNDDKKKDEKLAGIKITKNETDKIEKSLTNEDVIQSIKQTIINKVNEKIADSQNVASSPVDPPKLTRRRKPVDLTASSLERNFITPNRAVSEFCLKASDLEALPKTLRRSPYENEPPIPVYWRQDVEAKALEVYGSMENLRKELVRRDIERRKHHQDIFTIKRRQKSYRKEMGEDFVSRGSTEGLFGRSGTVVMTAVCINAANFIFKVIGWLYTGSHSMFSEAIHSFADTTNQLILAYGIHKSIQEPNSDHPYGYSNMRYVASLISGVGIFCVGTGLSLYHGITGLIDPQPIQDYYWAFFILGGSLVSEGATWFVAFNSIKKGAAEVKMNVKDYILRGHDPSVNVVLLEDLAAVLGVILAGSCMSISIYTQSAIPDAVGSLLVGGLLGTVASFIIYTNVAALVGRSIAQENLQRINAELESDIMVRAIHDVKGIDMGNYLVRYKAEIDFDGEQLTRSYLDKQNLNAILEEAQKIVNIDDLETFFIKHGEQIVDMMGAEIDRIEIKLKKKYPEIRHCDLEVL